MNNARKDAQDDARAVFAGHAVRAIVTGVNGDSLTVRREGMLDEEGPYGRLESYVAPVVGDLVLLLAPGTGGKRPVVLGRELR